VWFWKGREGANFEVLVWRLRYDIRGIKKLLGGGSLHTGSLDWRIVPFKSLHRKSKV